MNGVDNGSKGRRLMSLPSKARKERENEDLHLFRELHKREKERTGCLLLPVSDEFEHNKNGNPSFYRIQSIKKESAFEFLCDSNKSDYDWLKTPPATPLFPSLEMEATASSPLIVQIERSRPVVQPLSHSQLSSNSEASRRSNGMAPKSSTTKQKVPSRSITPTHRPRVTPSIEPKTPKIRTTTPTPTPNRRTTTTTIPADPTTKTTNLTEISMDFLSSNLCKSSSTNAKHQRIRTVSPLVRSTIASQISEFSDETPPNLRTDRSSSVTRGRQLHQAASAGRKTEQINPRRQSCSPSVTRGRRVEAKQENRGANLGNDQKRSEMTTAAYVLGSRMVQRVMNARKANGNEERDAKPQTRSGISESSRVAGFMSKSLADKTPRQMNIIGNKGRVK